MHANQLLRPIKKLSSQSRFYLVTMTLVSVVLIADGCIGLINHHESKALNVVLLLIGFIIGISITVTWIYRHRAR